ncbi:MAG: hypothetical protein GY811_30895, partial [Myxococcales bacterium]|nr:hypothetical protein [Myxococcales bacterium]
MSEARARLASARAYSRGVLDVVQALLAGDDAKWPEIVAEVHALAISVCERR